MKRKLLKSLIICFILILSTLSCSQVLATFACVRDVLQPDSVAENYKISRLDTRVKIIRAHGHDDSEWYRNVIGKETPDKKDIDRNNAKRFRHALKKYDYSEVTTLLKEVVRHEFSEDVKLVFMYCIISKSGRLEYAELIMNDADGKTLIHEYSDEQYRNFMDRVHETIEFAPWDCPETFCAGAFNLRWKEEESQKSLANE